MIRSRCVDVFQAKPDETAIAAEIMGVYRFRTLEPADFEASPLGREKGRATNFAQRMRLGHQAWGYLAPDGTVACYLWLSSPQLGEYQPDFELGLRAKIPSDAAYIWDCRSDPRHERQGLYRHGLVALAREAATIGARSVLIVTRRENHRSRNSILAVGFRQIGTMRLYGFGGLVLVAGRGRLTMAYAGSAVELPGLQNRKRPIQSAQP